jgi:RNA polymerase sigma-70 factor (ECF subfamily)
MGLFFNPLLEISSTIIVMSTATLTRPTASAPGGVRPVLAGDPANDAIPRLLEEHGGRLYSLAVRLTGNTHDAEEVVQDTFVQAYRKWHQFKGEANPGTWLYIIATRLARRKHRRRSGEPRRIASLNASLPATGPVPDLPSNEESPLAKQLKHEAIEHVERAVVELPLAFRLPLVLKDIVGFSVDQVAQITNTKEATVKTRLHRARLMLRDAIQQHLPTRDAPPPAYNMQVCMDLLRAKQEALDNGVEFPLPPEDFCDRCGAVFASMDLAAGACKEIGQGPLPDCVREALKREIEESARRKAKGA